MVDQAKSGYPGGGPERTEALTRYGASWMFGALECKKDVSSYTVPLLHHAVVPCKFSSDRKASRNRLGMTSKVWEEVKATKDAPRTRNISKRRPRRSDHSRQGFEMMRICSKHRIAQEIQYVWRFSHGLDGSWFRCPEACARTSAACAARHWRSEACGQVVQSSGHLDWQ
jgi:hypothetical protein